MFTLVPWWAQERILLYYYWRWFGYWIGHASCFCFNQQQAIHHPEAVWGVKPWSMWYTSLMLLGLFFMSSYFLLCIIMIRVRMRFRADETALKINMR